MTSRRITAQSAVRDSSDGSMKSGSSRPIMILALGVLGICPCSIFAAVPAWYLGGRALWNCGDYDETEVALIKLGRILGIIGTTISLLALYSVLVHPPRLQSWWY